MTNPYLQKIQDIEVAVADAVKLLRKAANLYDAAIALQGEETVAAPGTETTLAEDSDKEAQLRSDIERCQAIILDPKASVEKKVQASTSMKSYKGHLTRLLHKNQKTLSYQKGAKWTNRSK